MGGQPGAPGVGLTGQAGAAGQVEQSLLETIQTQTDEIVTAVAGISVDTLLAVVLDIPPLPDTLGTFEC